MIIIHKIDDFFFELFPDITSNDNGEIIKSRLESYYTFGSFKPSVTIENGFVKVSVDATGIISQKEDFNRAIALCERRNFSEAKPLIEKLIKVQPTHSELHRIYGQILSEEGDQENAINSLIEALRWDPKNGWALLMMGNIFAKHLNDIPTAMKYYDQAVKVNPDDNIAVNNIGANLMQQGKIQEAKKYFQKALDINSDYPNTYFALGMVADIEGNLQSAFENSIESLKKNRSGNPLYQQSYSQALSIANKISSSNKGKEILDKYLRKLEFEGEKAIEVFEDGTIPTAAKFEFAENYNRNVHTIRYNPKYPAVVHLQMHELVHLDFVIQARKANVNQLFISNGDYERKFIRSMEPTIKLLKKKGISENSIANYFKSLFEGLNRQIFNAPIDLFIEDFLYHKHQDLRPYQFISVLTMVREGLQAVTDKKILELSPSDVISKSKIYNLTGAMQLKDLFGIDIIKEYKASVKELKEAEAMYSEYLEYKEDKAPGEEYELVLNWAEDLNLNQYFELVDEQKFRNKSKISDLLEDIEKDPFDLNSDDSVRISEMEKFKKSQEELGTNMAVVMYMIDALKYFKDFSKDKIKNIAFEIAMVGTQGISPEGKVYKINSIPGKSFTGYNLLAYYYISWKLAIPEMLSQLQLPYDKEFLAAKTMYENGI